MVDVKQTLHIKRDVFEKIARVSGVIVFVIILLLIWYEQAFLSLLVLVIWMGVMFILKTLVDEPFVDERILEIQRRSSTRAAQVFATTLMAVILVGSYFGMTRENLACLEIVLAVFLLLKLIFTKYYERMI